MQLNPAVNRVANGRRLAARRIVMNTLASTPSQIWRKQVVYQNTDTATPASKLSFEALATSQQDEPNYEYAYVGMAYVLADHFNGGYIHKNDSLNNPTDLTLMAQIEPFDPDLPQLEQMQQVPLIDLKEGDLIGMMIYEGFILWFEIVGMTGQTVMADFGTKYILNRRDELKLQPMTGA